MINARPRHVAFFAALFLVCPAAAFVQGAGQIQPGTTVVTTGEAPVYLMPDTSRTPLRRLPAGTTATAAGVQNGWVQITFNDPQYGPRTGWIELRFVKGGAAPTTPSPARPGQTATTPGTVRSQPGTQPSRTAQRRRQAPAGRVFGGAALDRMAADESFEAVTGSSDMVGFGGGVQAVDLWRQLFVEFAVEYRALDGERVFVLDNQVYNLGIPVEIKTLPLDLSAGWRFPFGRVTPFVAGGVTFLRYQETSDFAEDDENVEEWKPGYLALGGVEVRVINNLHVRADFRYRRVEDILGNGGVTALFSESALGGAGASIKVVFGR